MYEEKQKFKPGFTLLEILVAMGIFLLILTGVASFLQTIFKSQNVIYTQVTNQKEARRTIEEFVKEARNASISSIGSYSVAQASSTSFTFYSDIDFDTYKEKVRYFADGAELKKGVIKPAGTPLAYNPATETVSVLAHDLIVGQTLFAYFDKNYTGASDPMVEPINIAQIRVVKVTVVIDQLPNISPEPLTVSSQVEIRNLKYVE